MSIKIMTAVWDLPLPTSDKLVAISLADQANDAGICWPSLSMIALRCGMSERNVARVIARLETCGLIARKNRAGTSNCYEVKPGSFSPKTPENGVTTPDTMSGVGMTPCQGGYDTMSGVGMTPCPTTPDTMSGEPKRTVNRTQSEPGSGQGEIELNPDWLPAEAWREFEAMRKRIGKPLTKRAKKGILADLDQLRRAGHDPETILRQSTAKDWMGVYEPKGVWADRQQNTTPAASQPCESAETTQWRYRLRDWHKTGLWLAEWGPRPDESGNFIPPELTQERRAS